ncbi:ImmA/IrrE family metallo-endopeptidase [Methylocystis sp. S23]|jgi:hypothetical protein
MAANPSDYHVDERNSSQLAADAERVRRLVGADHAVEFDPLLAIKFFEQTELPRKGLLKVVPFNASGVPPARVKFKPSLRLFVHEEVLEAATKYGDPRARFILAHEIGHMVEHDHNAKAFSEADAKRLTGWPKEERAEWQADTFADHLLLPIKFLFGYRFDVCAIALACNVEHQVVVRQIGALKSEKRYVCKACPECGCFTLARSGTVLKCETCSTITESN